MPVRGKLHGALARHQGRNIRLELQKKHEKEVHKKKRSRGDDSSKQQVEGDPDTAKLQTKSAKTAKIKSRSTANKGTDHSRTKSDPISEVDGDGTSSEDDYEDVDDDEPSDNEVGGAVIPAQQSGNPTADADDEDESDIPLSDLASQNSDNENDIVPYQKLTINNTAALTASLHRIALAYATLPFSEHMSVTSFEPTNISIPDINDDLNRELSFYAQSLSAVETARTKLKAEGIPFTRPNDYFAEMVKTDEHMGKIKARLVDDAARKKASQDTKRQRELRKFGKAVQQEKLKERAASKRAMLSKVDALKRKRAAGGAGATSATEADMFDVALDDAAEAAPAAKRQRREKPGKRGEPNRKRTAKDAKYGFGGKKRHSKSGNALSAGDVSGFSTARMKGKGRPGGAAQKRPGKNRRASMR